MSRRVDPADFTVCPCHNQSIKRVNLPSHLKNVKRSERKQIAGRIKKKGWFWNMVYRLRGQGHDIEEKDLPAMTDPVEEYPSLEELREGKPSQPVLLEE